VFRLLKTFVEGSSEEGTLPDDSALSSLSPHRIAWDDVVAERLDVGADIAGTRDPDSVPVRDDVLERPAQPADADGRPKTNGWSEIRHTCGWPADRAKIRRAGR